jgi:hypothetical protein
MWQLPCPWQQLGDRCQNRGKRVSAEGEEGERGREGGGGNMSRICSKIPHLAFLHGN